MLVRSMCNSVILLSIHICWRHGGYDHHASNLDAILNNIPTKFNELLKYTGVRPAKIGAATAAKTTAMHLAIKPMQSLKLALLL